jgi:signal transduction histidine kinase
MDSLRQKITFGYYLVGTLVVGVALFAFVELRLIELKMLAGAKVYEFFDATLEMRRFEKNLFLYHQAADWHEHDAFAGRARALLRDNAGEFALLAAPQQITSLSAELARYEQLMAEYWRRQEGGGSAQLEAAIRASGKRIVTLAGDIANTERAALRGALEQHRIKLVAFIAALIVLVIVAGQVLSRMVAHPLKQLEERMDAIAGGSRAKLDIRSGDREIVSLTEAFNRVMHELDLRQKHLVRSEKLASLGTLLSGVAHELNNPLSNISTSCQILIEEGEDGDAQFQRELLTQIDEQTLRARNIVRTLLDFARDREFNREALPLAALIEETLRFIKGQIPARVAIRREIPGGLTLHADKQRLQQVFLNLIKNAVEALEGAGEIVIRAARRAPGSGPARDADGFLQFGHCDNDAETVEIEIQDNGSGIPLEVLPRIFDPFYTTKDVGEGSGLGLFIAFEIIEEHGGCIAVSSVEGQGTTFVVRLPLNLIKEKNHHG